MPLTLSMKKLRNLGRLVAGVMVLALANPAMAQLDFDTKAKFAILMDYESGTVLFQKNADAPMEPASMAKLMTVAVVFDLLKKGRVKMEDQYFVSHHAWETGGAASGGSTMFAKLDSQIAVGDLLRSVIIQSGNDAAIVLAEGIGGSEETFARMMNEESKDIGLTGSNFTNSTGLPDPEMHVTARDLALLAQHIIREFPDYYPIFSEQSFTWNNIRQENRNALLEYGIGVDGLKTGHTEAAGYGSVVSTTDGGRRLIAVLHGMASQRERAEEARKLVLWGSRSFERISAFKPGDVLGRAAVYGGEAPDVGLVGKGAVSLYLPKGGKSCVTAEISYRGPLRPPVAEGDEVAQLRVMCNGQLIQVAPLFAAESVAEGGLFRRAADALKELLIGWI